MAKLNQLTRYSRIINKLSGLRHYVPASELIDAMGGLSDFGFNYTIRTLQRDIRSIEQVFGIEIRNRKGYGYYIASVPDKTEAFTGLLSDFEILDSVNSHEGLHEFVLPEHRKQIVSISISNLLTAIRDRKVIKFSYIKPQSDGTMLEYEAQPYYLKQSQTRWYLYALVDGQTRSFELGRIESLRITNRAFERQISIDIKDEFTDTFGIMNDKNLPAEDITLKVNETEWRYLKTLPIHHSQTLLEECPDGSKLISIHLKPSYDFIMDLLSRGPEVEVISPVELREKMKARIHEMENKYNR